MGFVVISVISTLLLECIFFRHTHAALNAHFSLSDAMIAGVRSHIVVLEGQTIDGPLARKSCDSSTGSYCPSFYRHTSPPGQNGETELENGTSSSTYPGIGLWIQNERKRMDRRSAIYDSTGSGLSTTPLDGYNHQCQMFNQKASLSPLTVDDVLFPGEAMVGGFTSALSRLFSSVSRLDVMAPPEFRGVSSRRVSGSVIRPIFSGPYDAIVHKSVVSNSYGGAGRCGEDASRFTECSAQQNEAAFGPIEAAIIGTGWEGKSSLLDFASAPLHMEYLPPDYSGPHWSESVNVTWTGSWRLAPTVIPGFHLESPKGINPAYFSTCAQLESRTGVIAFSEPVVISSIFMRSRSEVLPEDAAVGLTRVDVVAEDANGVRVWARHLLTVGTGWKDIKYSSRTGHPFQRVSNIRFSYADKFRLVAPFCVGGLVTETLTKTIIYDYEFQQYGESRGDQSTPVQYHSVVDRLDGRKWNLSSQIPVASNTTLALLLVGISENHVTDRYKQAPTWPITAGQPFSWRSHHDGQREHHPTKAKANTLRDMHEALAVDRRDDASELLGFLSLLPVEVAVWSVPEMEQFNLLMEYHVGHRTASIFRDSSRQNLGLPAHIPPSIRDLIEQVVSGGAFPAEIPIQVAVIDKGVTHTVTLKTGEQGKIEAWTKTEAKTTPAEGAANQDTKPFSELRPLVRAMCRLGINWSHQLAGHFGRAVRHES
eukprot:GHVN01015921.1.p1 GENE.GHVN01015921.1~~GHVN01015921.1.p1  ORF type:complete len:709 (+),score=44.96 GHVN01015921.1:173-2299(+)